MERRLKGSGLGGVAKPVAQFLIVNVVVLTLVGIAAAFMPRRTYVSEAIRDAKQVATDVVRGPVQGAASDQLAVGNPAAVARMDAVVRRSVLGSVIVAVKVWTADGRIVYSTDTQEIGAADTLDARDTEPLRDGHVTADLSSLGEADDLPERALHAHLIEVYQLIRAPGGAPLTPGVVC